MPLVESIDTKGVRKPEARLDSMGNCISLSTGELSPKNSIRTSLAVPMPLVMSVPMLLALSSHSGSHSGPGVARQVV